MHSPEPWTPFGIRVTDADQWIIAQCRNEANAQRITACVNACHGLPDMNGILTMVGDMKAAILTNDPELLEIVRKRLIELAGWPQGTGTTEYDEMKPMCIAHREYFQRPFFKSEVKP